MLMVVDDDKDDDDDDDDDGNDGRLTFALDRRKKRRIDRVEQRN